MFAEGDIPTINVIGNNLPEAWEKAVLAVWDHGVDIKTEYDKPEDPPSKDATVMITVANPFNEPRIHKNFPGGPEELESYRQEVVDGIHDHWINPEEGSWCYTYHERLFAYAPLEDLKQRNQNPSPFKPVNQIDYVVDKLSSSPHSRRVQATIWMPTCDPKVSDSACLQRLWFRMLKDEDGTWILNMNSHWRSRDGYKAWTMNCIALTSLMENIANRISAKTGEEVKVGRYVDISDSFHLYGSYFEEIKLEIEKMRDGNFESRSWKSDHEAFKFMTDEAKKKLSHNVDYYRKGGN